MLFKLTDVTKSYGGHDVLRDVSFQINPGEKVGLVGRNGAGKTTVFRMITGGENPDSGTVEKINRLRIGMLDQHVDFSESESVHTAALSAFRELHDIEAEMRRLELRMVEDHSEQILEDYAALQTRFEREGGFDYVARAEAVLLGLKFDKSLWDMNTKELSGGQMNRLGMVRLLLADVDLLLLDEPTNHLDVETVEWLENHLSATDLSYVVISHDRYFLDRTCERIIEIDGGVAASYKGNYSKYLVESALRKEQLKREFENQRAFIQKTEAFIRKNLAGQKTKQAKSRRNMLERLERKTDLGGDAPTAGFALGDIIRAGANVLKVEDLEIGYPGTTLAKGLNFTIHRGESLGVIGANGTGKSTLLKTVLGEIRELSGSIVWGTKVLTGYYSQQLENLNDSNDLISELRSVRPSAENGELRSFLAGFLFFGDDVFKKVRDLSGGEKGRMALAKLVYSNVNVLILDEPTNHLDIPSREALERALEDFKGTIISVSHDRFFLDRIANRILAFGADGTVTDYNGNYSQFHEWMESRGLLDGSQIKGTDLSEEQVEIQSSGRESSKSKNEIRKLKERAETLEQRIQENEAGLKVLAGLISDPMVAGDSERLEEATSDYAKLEHELAQYYSEWEEVLGELPED
ncbi:MAG: ABC-F family ATP-binding cassette domain-containing protein [Pyrinomonadaceae bacterium]